jgi:hypothetical protein
MARTTAARRVRERLDIDDPADLRNQQIVALTRPNPEFRGRQHVWVFYARPLSRAWESILWRPGNVTEAAEAVDRARDSNIGWDTLRVIARQVDHIDERSSNDEVRLFLARALASRRLSAIRKNNRAIIGKTDTTVLAQLNGQYRTSVDFERISRWEGGQYLNGYIPIRGGVVYQNSGLTIATGYDLGQVDARELGSVGLDAATLAKLTPYTSMPFRNYTRAELLDYISRTIGAPVPDIPKAQADLLDKSSHGKHLSIAINIWDRAKSSLVPAYRSLPTPWQTVLLSRFFHAGTISRLRRYSRFWTNATAGEWATAIAALRTSDPGFAGRLAEEADYLATNVPAAVVRPRRPAVRPVRG